MDMITYAALQKQIRESAGGTVTPGGGSVSADDCAPLYLDLCNYNHLPLCMVDGWELAASPQDALRELEKTVKGGEGRPVYCRIVEVTEDDEGNPYKFVFCVIPFARFCTDTGTYHFSTLMYTPEGHPFINQPNNIAQYACELRCTVTLDMQGNVQVYEKYSVSD